LPRGEIKVKGLATPEQVIIGPLFDNLLSELGDVGVRFRETPAKV
jgi:hypothetical protein